MSVLVDDNSKEVAIILPLIQLEEGTLGRITQLKGGPGFIRRLGTRGLTAGQNVRVVAKQPGGPLVIESGRCKMTIGRGMARKILVEVPT